jgi:SAM-dependent methyltransferase
MAVYPIIPSIPRSAALVDLSSRAQPADLPELMDQPCSRSDLRACLRDLAWVNRTLLGYRPTLHWLNSLNLKTLGAPGLASETWDRENLHTIRILDVGCGFGDTLRVIEKWAQRRNLSVELTGLDLNPDATAIAAEATPPHSRIRWVTSDVFAYAPAQPSHLILSSLFAHHLNDAEVVRFVQWMERNAMTAWFINDLSRDIIPFRLFYWLSRVMRLHPFVQHDGPVSIARAFDQQDWRRFCASAGLSATDFAVQAFTPARLCVSRNKRS